MRSSEPSFEVLRARLLLMRMAEPPAPAIQQDVAVHGPLDTVERIRRCAAPAAVLGEVIRPDARIDNDLRAIDNGTAQLLMPEQDDWPSARLASLTGHGTLPLALWVRGSASLAELTSAAVTITGTSACSNYGSTVAADLSGELARAAVTVVSGGSLGVDQAAHHGTLVAQGRSIVVLANGADRTHPHQHAQLYQTVIDQGGLLISEYPIGTRPTRTRFHARCRLLAALSTATVIVEAGPRSRALAIARTAHNLGRRVYGVPGPIYSVTSRGVHELLRTGAATVATSAEHINHKDAASCE